MLPLDIIGGTGTRRGLADGKAEGIPERFPLVEPDGSFREMEKQREFASGRLFLLSHSTQSAE